MNRDVTTSVMGRVVKYEKKRTSVWMWTLVAALGVLAALLAGSIYVVGTSFFEDEFSWLVSFYFVDFDTFRQTWREAVSFVWDIIPHSFVYFALFLAAVIVAAIFLTRSKRRIMKRRQKEADGYAKRLH